MNASPSRIIDGVPLAQTTAGEPGRTSETDALVRLSGVTKRFGTADTGFVTAVDGVDLVAPRGSVTAIIGRSGAGKSTLIRLVNGLEKPTEGSVVVDGIDIAALDEASLRTRRRSIGMIFQHFNLLTSRTAFDNVALPLEIAGLNRRAIEAKVAPLLDLVGLGDKRDRYPSELSGGQKQRVGIARALATDPTLLLSDEATSALDPETTQSVLALLSRINRELGLTILLITHEMEVVKRIADTVAVIDGGRIVERGSVFDVFSAPQHDTTRALLAALPGQSLPDAIARELRPEPFDGSHAILRLTLVDRGEGALRLAETFDAAGSGHRILSGGVEEIGGRSFGTFILSLPAGTLAPATAAFTALGARTEVLGHVA